MDALHIKSHTCFPVKTKRLLEAEQPSMRSINPNPEEVNRRIVLRQPDHRTNQLFFPLKKKDHPEVVL